MKQLTLCLLAFSILVISSSCKKKNESCTLNPVANEAGVIQAYAASKGINATAHPSGLFYEIITPGSGVNANTNSNVQVTYRGELLNGTLFDEATTPNATPWRLTGLIEGWVIGIPMIKKGGRIKLIIPSALAYGCEGSGPIPGNSPLYFDITLVNFN